MVQGGFFMKIKLTDEEKDNLSYSDVAALILENSKKKQKIQDIFKKVIKLLDLDDDDFENNIGTFFEQIITDKRFIMLDGGYCDLKINHSSEVVLEDDEEDIDIQSEEEMSLDIEEDNYDDDANPDDDADDDLQDLVILDENEDLDDSEI